MYELQDNQTSRVAMWSGIFSSMSTIKQSQNIPAPNTLSIIHTLVGFTSSIGRSCVWLLCPSIFHSCGIPDKFFKSSSKIYFEDIHDSKLLKF